MIETDTDRKVLLYDVLNSYTSNEDESRKVAQMAVDNASVKDYVIALADGLKYGNWPWSNYKSTSAYKGVE